MLLRSIKIVQFRGVADLHARALRESGVADVPLPPGADASDLAEALRFAFLGRTRDDAPWVAQGCGHAYVEVAFTASDGGLASVFRGVDRRGATQCSLRELDGARITSGDADVAARLAALVGAPLDAWERATFAGEPGEHPGAGPEPLAPAATSEAAPDPPAPPSLEVARGLALSAIETLRRSLRAAELERRIADDVAALRRAGASLRAVRASLAAAPRAAPESERALELADETLALWDATMRRSARAVALVQGAPGGAPPAADAGEGPAWTASRIRDLGDSILAAYVEHDALLARGVPPPRAAAIAVEASFAILGRATGEERLGREALVRLASTPGAVDADRDGRDPDAVASALRRAAESLARSTPTLPFATGTTRGAGPGDPLPRRTSDRGSAPTGRASTSGSGTRPVDSVGDAAARDRAALRGALRADPHRDGAGPGATRCIVLDRVPRTFGAAEELAAFVAGEAPHAVQVVVGRPA